MPPVFRGFFIVNVLIMKNLGVKIYNFLKMLSWAIFVLSICGLGRSLFYGDFPIDLSLPLFCGAMCLVAIFEIDVFSGA